MNSIKMLYGVLITILMLTKINCAQTEVEIENAFPNLSFTRPVDLQFPIDGTNRLFVVEQAGIISVFENNHNVESRRIFLDIRDKVQDSGNEEGLLGLAFHPDYQNNGYFFVDYTASNPDRTVIARYQVSPANPDSAIKESEFVILEVGQPFSNHNAGQIVFGADGYLYITMGDGGSGGDPEGNGQNLATLLGSILRIDVNQSQGELNYAIPSDNPFVGNQREFREEIYAYGLRNPWRISFDSETGRLWAADVGQNAFEEIDIIESGKNYGWNIMEGFHCYNASECDDTGLTLPVWEYSHSLGQSITGGFVYRGSRLPDLVGLYIYADFITGRIWALDYNDDGSFSNSLLTDSNLNISSFGLDRDNELYMCAFDGNIYQFKSTTRVGQQKSDNIPLRFELAQNYPNPFNSKTIIRYFLSQESQVSLTVYNIVGERVTTLMAGVQSEGEHSVHWDGTHENGQMQSGIYIYKLAVNGVEAIRKMSLLK